MTIEEGENEGQESRSCALHGYHSGRGVDLSQIHGHRESHESDMFPLHQSNSETIKRCVDPADKDNYFGSSFAVNASNHMPKSQVDSPYLPATSCSSHISPSSFNIAEGSSTKPNSIPGAMLAAASLGYTASATSNAINTTTEQHTPVDKNDNATALEPETAVIDGQILTGAFDMMLGRRPSGSLVDVFKSSLHDATQGSFCHEY